MKRLLRYLKNHKKQLVFGPFFKLLEAIFELIVPLVMAKIIDVGIVNRDSAYVLKMSGVIVLLGVCGLGFALTCQFLAAKCAYGFGTELREALYRHINSLSYTSIDRIGTSSLVNRLTNDSMTVQNGVNMFVPRYRCGCNGIYDRYAAVTRAFCGGSAHLGHYIFHYAPDCTDVQEDAAEA